VAERELYEDEAGNVMMFATRAGGVALRERKPGQVAPQPVGSGGSIRRGARSGNPNADPVSGRFGSKGGGGSVTTGGKKVTLHPSAVALIRKQKQSLGADRVTAVAAGTEAQVTLWKGNQSVASITVPTSASPQATVDAFVGQAGVEGTPQRSSVPQGADPDAWQRRVDAVRDAAREFDSLGAGDVKDFLKARPGINVNQVDVDRFLVDVQEQRLDDLADLMDVQLRGTIEGMKKSRRFVTVKAPKGWQKRVVAKLDDTQYVQLLKRLEGKGFDPQDLIDNVISKISDEGRRAKVEQLYGESRKKTKKPKQNAAT
jgi:hypothetical protein